MGGLSDDFDRVFKVIDLGLSKLCKVALRPDLAAAEKDDTLGV